MGLLRIFSIFNHRNVHCSLKRIVNLKYYQQNIDYFKKNNIADYVANKLGITNDKGKTCLELACGYGWFSALMAKKYNNVKFYGYDIDKEVTGTL